MSKQFIALFAGLLVLCSIHRRPKLSLCGVIIFFSKKNLYANVQLVKTKLVTAVIYCYITTLRET